MQFFHDFNEEIPTEFYSSENHQIPTKCSVCDQAFGNRHFFIEKAFQKTHDHTEFQMTFEYAICEHCKKGMMKSISKKSMEHIQEFVKDGFPGFQSFDPKDLDIQHLLNHCMASGQAIEELDAYHLVGIFKNGKMVQMPMVYGEHFIEAYSEILSEETKDFFDDFFNHITLLPPTLAKILEDEKPKRPVLI
ncbi:MAG TPA: hypothetical protein VL022_01875 [Moheibacter sp.]|nr:hypothetical protein [Moheibacter sp.]